MADIDDEPLFAMSEADLAIMKAEKVLVEFTLTTVVSPEVREECKRELAEAKKRGYKNL